MSPRNGFSAGAACAPLVASLTSSTSQGGSSVRDEGAEPSSDGGSTAERAEAYLMFRVVTDPETTVLRQLQEIVDRLGDGCVDIEVRQTSNIHFQIIHIHC